MKTKLNLIPDYRKKEIHQRNVFLKIMRWGFEFMAVYIIFMLLLFVVGYILKLNLQINLIQLNPNNISKFSEFKKYDEEIKNINGKVGEIKKIQEGQFNWTKFLLRLNEIVPEGVVLNRISTKDFSILLAGVSNNRDTLLSFKDKLSVDNCFTGVELPLSYMVLKENLDFQIIFTLKKECLK